VTWLVVDRTVGLYRTVDDWSPRQSDAQRYSRLSDAHRDAREHYGCRVVRLVSRADTRRSNPEEERHDVDY
jgi:hypothetical protein